MERALNRLWYGSSGAAALLAPLSWLYGAVVAARRSAYARGWFASHHVARPIVVIGNLTVGGTGKTPLTVWLALALRERGYRVGIVSRGYGRSGDAPRAVEPDDDWRVVGDEPLLLRRHASCPTIVGTDRVAAANALVAQGVDVILADDGLQHLRLARDFELVVVDGARGFGNQRLLPAGPLREGISRLSTANVIVVNGKAEHASLAGAIAAVPAARHVLEMRLELGDALALAGGESRPLDRFRGELVHAVAGIGNPARFFRELRGRGIEPVEHAFPDHHPFAPADLDFGDRLPVLMTEKDAVKCRSFADARLWQVPVAVRFGEAHARELLDSLTAKLGPAPGAKG
jgi:tetraacyldisaccharide 4'-kinase